MSTGHQRDTSSLINPWPRTREAKAPPAHYWWLLIGPWALSSCCAPTSHLCLLETAKLFPRCQRRRLAVGSALPALKDAEALLACEKLASKQSVKSPVQPPPPQPKCLSLTSRPLHSTLMIGYLAGWEPTTRIPIADLNLGFFQRLSTCVDGWFSTIFLPSLQGAAVRCK